MKYGLVGKLMQSGNILGYFIVDRTNKKLMVSKDKLFKLAESGSIAEWSVIDDGEEKHLYSEEYQLRNLPNMVKADFEYADVIDKYTDENEVYYKCLTDTQKEISISASVIWNMTKAGLIRNLKASKCNGTRVISQI